MKYTQIARIIRGDIPAEALRGDLAPRVCCEEQGTEVKVYNCFEKENYSDAVIKDAIACLSFFSSVDSWFRLENFTA